MSDSSLSIGVVTDRTSLSDKKIQLQKKKDRKKELKAPHVLQKIFHTKCTTNSQYYLSHAKSVDPTNLRDVLAESTPFKYPDDLEQFSFKVVQKVWANKLARKELGMRYCDKTNVRSRQTQDLLRRLYVREPAEVSGSRTLFDVDPEFFSIADGRPINKRFSMSQYMEDLRNVLRTKLMTGFRNDEILMIEEKVQEEQRVIHKIKDRYRTYLDSFETFLSKDYDEAMKELRTAERESIKTIEKSDEINRLYTRLASVEFAVHKLEERWRDLKMYQKFLYYISPISWRKVHDYINKLESTTSEPTTVFMKYRLTSRGQIPSLDTLVDVYLEDICHEQEPELYFKHPMELKKVFRFIEVQNLNCLLHTEDMAIPMENMKDTMRQARKKFELEASGLQELISSLGGSITWEEQCAEGLKNKAMRLINGEFRSLVADDDILKLHVFVEDVYETCIAPNDSNFSILDMMKSIEQYYNELVLNLDRMPQNIVKKSEKHRFAEEAKLAKLSKEAAAKITLVDRITWRLKKSLEPPYLRTTKPMVWRSAPPEKPPKPPKPPRQPTAVERDYLAFFTDYCMHGDSLKDYGIDLTVEETDLKKYSAMRAFKPDEED